MAKDPAALLYIDNWRVSTTEMKADERGYYMDLILHQFDKGDLPNNVEELANICRVRFSEFKRFEQVFEQVLKQKFELNENGRLQNSFANEIIRKRDFFKNKRSNAGKMSYLVRFVMANLPKYKKYLDRLKDDLDLNNIDTKNEQVFKQVIEQKVELYINGDGDGDINKDRIIDLKELCSKNPSFIPIVEKWFKYKKERKQTYKKTGAETFVKNLIRDTKGDAEDAAIWVDYSISQNYSGCFAPKNSNSQANGKRKESDY